MFLWLKRKTSPVPVAVSGQVDNASDLTWKNIDQTSFYAGVHKRQFERVAELLSQEFPGAFPRFNEKEKCVEIVLPSPVIIAKVSVHGEVGLPYEAIVRSNLSTENKALFTKHIPVRVFHDPMP